MYTLVLIVKAAAVASLAILAWAAFAGRRGDEAKALEADDLAPRDLVGARVLKGFTAMLMVGVAAMFAITVMDMASHL